MCFMGIPKWGLPFCAATQNLVHHIRTESNFLTGFTGQGFSIRIPMFWLDGARLPHLVLLVLPLPEDEFGKLIIQ
jgi:hypothetical protein